MFKTRYWRLLILISALTLSACAPRPDPDNSAEMARVFGECSFKLNTSMLDLPVVPDDDPRVTVIEGIVDELLSSRYQQFPWTVKTTLLDSPMPNAFTTGGGYLAAFSGVYAMTDDEAALAGIIAHELAHMDKTDPMELAEYLEVMLASRLSDSGLEDYDTGQALQTVVDFCLAIPGLVSWQWPRDINEENNPDVSETYNDTAVPYIGFTYSDDPDSPYYPETRDPHKQNVASACNNKQRAAYDEFVVINPEAYVQAYPDADSLPPIPDDIAGGIGGLPGVQSLWAVDPWLAFQHTAFARYAECQADEAAILNLFASGYNPLALNSAFETILWLFPIDEATLDWRFLNHPSQGQRIEDNQTFINLNSDRLPTVADIQANPDYYQDYITMADRIPEFEALRDTARERLTGTATPAAVAGTGHHEEYEPVTVVDLAVALRDAMASSDKAGIASAGSDARCNLFRSVYESFTGKRPDSCVGN